MTEGDYKEEVEVNIGEDEAMSKFDVDLSELNLPGGG